jgi:hypothetical protein
MTPATVQLQESSLGPRFLKDPFPDQGNKVACDSAGGENNSQLRKLPSSPLL